MEPDDGVFAWGLTVIIASALAAVCPLLAVSLKSYTPAVVNIAVVTGVLALANSTGPAPVTVVQPVVIGSAPSIADPFRVMILAGNVMVWLGPALTTGG